MSDRAIGWVFVVVQNVLLLALIFLPGGDDFPVPGWLQLVALALFVGGAAIAIAASLSLGTALRPTPVPRADGELRTDGVYRFVRHPIYTGLILIVAALALRSGSAVVVVLAVGTVGFFGVKTRWEERALVERFAGYRDYAARTPRFIPRPFG